MKFWIYEAEVNLCAEHIVTILVKANTRRKAIIKAKEALKKDGHFAVFMIKCEEAKNFSKPTPFCLFCGSHYCNEPTCGKCYTCIWCDKIIK